MHDACGRPKILTQTAIKIIKKAKYGRGFGFRQIENLSRQVDWRATKKQSEITWKWSWSRDVGNAERHRCQQTLRGKNGCYSRGSIDIGNSKTDVMFYLVTNRRIKCSMFQTHAMTPFGVRKKKMFLLSRRSSLVRLFLCGEVWQPQDLRRIYATPFCTSAVSIHQLTRSIISITF